MGPREAAQPPSTFMPRTSLALWALCALGALSSFIVAISGGFSVGRGALHLSAHSIWAPLVISVTSGLMAAAIRMTGTGSVTDTRRGVRFAAALLCLVVGLDLLLQAQPAPPPTENACLFDYQLKDGFRFFLNCDSPEFLALAEDPSIVFTHTIRESRPMSFVLPYLVSKPLTLLPAFSSIPVNPPHQTSFLAYVLVNLAAILVSLLCFTWTLEAGTGVRGGPELLFALVILSANDITKLFMWTPHVQIYNLTVPCLAMWVSFRALRRGAALTTAQAIAIGLALGLCFMAYGGFAVPVICLAAIQLLTYRRLLPAVILAVTSLLPSLIWIVFVTVHAGAFYSHEVQEYREFVWMGDCVRSGWKACVPLATKNLLTFLNTAAPILMIPALGVCVGRLAREIWLPLDAATPAPPSRALAQAIGVTLAVTTLFFGAMGFYMPRLIWPIVPPLLMLFVVDWQALRVARPALGSLPVRLTVAVVCLAHVLILASRFGPYR
jgi:hypothetical protein